MGTRAILGTLILVGAGAGGVYLADQMVLAPGRALQRQIAERDAQIRALSERNQALEAAVRLLRHTERRARLVVLDQGPGTEGQVKTRVRFTELDSQGNAVGEPRELSLEGEEIYVDALVIKFEDSFVTAGDALKGKALLLFRRIFSDRRRPADGVRARALGPVLGAGQQSRGGTAPRRPRPARRGGVDPAPEGPRLHHHASLDGRAGDPGDPVARRATERSRHVKGAAAAQSSAITRNPWAPRRP